MFINKSNIYYALKQTRLIYPHVEKNDVLKILNNLIVVPPAHRLKIKRSCYICYTISKTQAHIIHHSNHHFKSKIIVDNGDWNSHDMKRIMNKESNILIYDSGYMQQYEKIMGTWTEHFALGTEMKIVLDTIYGLICE